MHGCASRSNVGTLALVAVFALGCQPLRHAAIDLSDPSIDPVVATADDPASNATPLNLDALKNTHWVLPVQVSPIGAAGSRWKNDTVDAVWSAAAVNRDALATLLIGSDATLATNAAICLARLGDPRAIARLAASSGDSQLPLKLRLPAIDALGQIEDPAAVAALQAMNSPSSTSTYTPEVHAEQLYALARHVDAADDPRFSNFGEIASVTAEVKLAALAAWSHGRQAVVPPAIVEWRTDFDPRVRAMTLNALTARGSTSALVAAKAGLNDSELDVRLAAIKALGKCESPEARKLVTPLLNHSGELVRAAAVEALARLGDNDAVRKGTQDKSWRVRNTIASILPEKPDQAHRKLAEVLVVDRSVEVQRQTVASMASWPMPLAGPVLLTALEKSTYSVQKAALTQLAERWPTAREHSVDLPKEKLTVSVMQLRARWSEQFGDPDRADVAQLAANPVKPNAIDRTWLDDLASADVSTRRRIAERLAREAIERPLPTDVVQRLGILTERERDVLVWQSVLHAVKASDDPTAQRLAYAAIGNESDEVRRLACEHLAGHPAEEHVAVLLPVIGDPQPSVVRAAIHALDRINSSPVESFRRALASQDRRVRLDAAAALVRRNDETGFAAMERLAFDPDTDIRRLAAQLMGDLGRREFVPTLMQLLDQGFGVGQVAQGSLAKVIGEEMANQITAETQTSADRVAAWRRWWDHERRQ